jgi:hypothetical protein
MTDPTIKRRLDRDPRTAVVTPFDSVEDLLDGQSDLEVQFVRLVLVDRGEELAVLFGGDERAFGPVLDLDGIVSVVASIRQGLVDALKVKDSLPCESRRCYLDTRYPGCPNHVTPFLLDHTFHTSDGE